MIDGIRLWAPASLSTREWEEVHSKSKNLRIARNEGGVAIYGSFAVFVHGEAITAPTLAECEVGMETLGELLHVNPSAIRTNGLEFGPNIVLENRIAHYLHAFGERPGTAFGMWTEKGVRTLQYGDSGTSVRLFKFYDKLAKEKKELAKLQSQINKLRYLRQDAKLALAIQRAGILKAAIINSKTEHILRPEIVLKKRLMQQVRQLPGFSKFKGDFIPASMLCDPDFLHALSALWLKEYFRIPKRKDFLTRSNGKPFQIHGVKDYLILTAAESLGKRRVDDEYKRIDSFEVNRETRKRLRRRARELASMDIITGPSPFIEELDRKVQEAAVAALSS